MNRQSIGIDFGTTNSTLAVAIGGEVRIARFPFFEREVDTFRSILFFENKLPGGRTPPPLAGPSAIERYLEPHEAGRLIQSLKSFAASASFQSTQINGRQFKLEELIGVLLRILRSACEKQFGPLGNRATVGRPVRFVGSEKSEDEARALRRLRRAYEIAGFDQIEFQYEPIGAAYAYAQRLRAPELVLIADFGGGTSDFSLIRLERGRSHEILATAGVPIGGDTFDARIIRHLVSPLLGLGTNYQSMDKLLPVPQSLYRKLESWHHLSFLRSKENIRILESVRAQAFEPQAIQRFLEIVQSDLGYHLHQSVQKTKMDLSRSAEAEFVFTDISTDIHRLVTRTEFESWIAEDLARISSCVGDLLASAGLAPSEIDRVFLTGGSSLVPALRTIFVNRFGEEKIAGGGEFTSVASGLALAA